MSSQEGEGKDIGIDTTISSGNHHQHPEPTDKEIADDHDSNHQKSSHEKLQKDKSKSSSSFSSSSSSSSSSESSDDEKPKPEPSGDIEIMPLEEKTIVPKTEAFAMESDIEIVPLEEKTTVPQRKAFTTEPGIEIVPLEEKTIVPKTEAFTTESDTIDFQTSSSWVTFDDTFSKFNQIPAAETQDPFSDIQNGNEADIFASEDIWTTGSDDIWTTSATATDDVWASSFLEPILQDNESAISVDASSSIVFPVFEAHSAVPASKVDSFDFGFDIKDDREGKINGIIAEDNFFSEPLQVPFPTVHERILDEAVVKNENVESEQGFQSLLESSADIVFEQPTFKATENAFEHSAFKASDDVFPESTFKATDNAFPVPTFKASDNVFDQSTFKGSDHFFDLSTTKAGDIVSEQSTFNQSNNLGDNALDQSSFMMTNSDDKDISVMNKQSDEFPVNNIQTTVTSIEPAFHDKNIDNSLPSASNDKLPSTHTVAESSSNTSSFDSIRSEENTKNFDKSKDHSLGEQGREPNAVSGITTRVTGEVSLPSSVPDENDAGFPQSSLAATSLEDIKIDLPTSRKHVLHPNGETCISTEESDSREIQPSEDHVVVAKFSASSEEKATDVHEGHINSRVHSSNITRSNIESDIKLADKEISENSKKELDEKVHLKPQTDQVGGGQRIIISKNEAVVTPIASGLECANDFTVVGKDGGVKKPLHAENIKKGFSFTKSGTKENTIRDNSIKTASFRRHLNASFSGGFSETPPVVDRRNHMNRRSADNIGSNVREVKKKTTEAEQSQEKKTLSKEVINSASKTIAPTVEAGSILLKPDTNKAEGNGANFGEDPWGEGGEIKFPEPALWEQLLEEELGVTDEEAKADAASNSPKVPANPFMFSGSQVISQNSSSKKMTEEVKPSAETEELAADIESQIMNSHPLKSNASQSSKLEQGLTNSAESQCPGNDIRFGEILVREKESHASSKKLGPDMQEKPLMASRNPFDEEIVEGAQNQTHGRSEAEISHKTLQEGRNSKFDGSDQADMSWKPILSLNTSNSPAKKMMDSVWNSPRKSPSPKAEKQKMSVKSLWNLCTCCSGPAT